MASCEVPNLSDPAIAILLISMKITKINPLIIFIAPLQISEWTKGGLNYQLPTLLVGSEQTST